MEEEKERGAKRRRRMTGKKGMGKKSRRGTERKREDKYDGEGEER